MKPYNEYECDQCNWRGYEPCPQHHQGAVSLVRSDALLADLVAFVKASPCACTPLFDDQPDGAKFGPSCERCKLLERVEDMQANIGKGDRQ
jgi:hypothetical protein